MSEHPGPPDSAPGRKVTAVAFDLGGVLLSLRHPLENFGLTMSEASFLERWLASPSVREFERGAIEASAFAESVVREFALRMDGPQFLERFNAWPERLFPDTLALLDAVPEGVRRALLSNTNAEHWGREEISGALAGRFDLEFLSFRTGLLKPDRAAFAQVTDTCQCPASEVVFFDDNPVNVTAARQFGMRAYLSKGTAEAMRVIKQL